MSNLCTFDLSSNLSWQHSLHSSTHCRFTPEEEIGPDLLPCRTKRLALIGLTEEEEEEEEMEEVRVVEGCGGEGEGLEVEKKVA